MFFLAKKSQKETFFDILDSKECFLDLKSEVLKKSKKSTLCKGFSPWFFSKNRPFSHMFFFLSKKSQKETFFDILDRKEWVLDHKRKVLKNSKKSTFCNGVTPWFLSKNRPFPHTFFLSKQSQKETFIYLLHRNKCFLEVKNEVLKKSKNRHFEKGLVHGFCQKIDFFFISCFLSKERQNKHFLIFWIEKNAFKTTKKTILKNSKKIDICKGVSPWFLSKNRRFSYMFFFLAKKARK